jgi:hypothetical protein
MEIPECPTHKIQMVPRAPGGTPEQKWCGQWFDCPEGRCLNTGLINSPELEASLAEQRRRSSQPKQPALGL